MSSTGRLHNLDYLRGIAAAGIMVYHYSMWTHGHADINSFIARVGVYGVSIFYVLSGLTLFLVYQDRMIPSWNDLKGFFKKRILRIFPLLWLATVASITLPGARIDWSDVFLNFSGLFGFIAWDDYVATGAWSIGNELVFYVFFPLFVLFSKRQKWLLLLLALLILACFVYFSFYRIQDSAPLRGQWHNYVNPLNQVYLFLAGYLIGFLFKNWKVNSMVSLIFIAGGFAMAVYYPLYWNNSVVKMNSLDDVVAATLLKGNPVHLVSGWNRVAFTLSCLLVCFGFYKLSLSLPSLIHKPLSFLGEASYSVYLLHPIVYVWVFYLSENYYVLPKDILLYIAFAITLFSSYFVYHYFEKVFMRMGRTKSV